MRDYKCGKCGREYRLDQYHRLPTVQRRQTGFEYYTPELASIMADRMPVFAVERQGVALLELYRVMGRSIA